jgi:hypothetical protein
MNSSIPPERPQQAMRFEHDDAKTAHSALRLPAAPQLVMLHATQPPSWVSGEGEDDVNETFLSPEETSQIDYDPSFEVTEFAVPARVRSGSLATHLRAVMTGTAAVVAIWVGLIVFPNTAHDDIWSRNVSAAPLAPSAAPPSDRSEVASVAPSQVTPAAYVVAQHGAFVQPEPSHPVDQSLQRLAQPPAQSPAYQQQQPEKQQRVVSPQQLQQQPVQPRYEITMTSKEADRLLSLGEKFLGQGDIETARAILERVAEARDPRAALMLGTTYDPAGLRAMGVIGLPADLNKARSWYSRAVDFGSHEAGKRLALLSLQTR